MSGQPALRIKPHFFFLGEDPVQTKVFDQTRAFRIRFSFNPDKAGVFPKSAFYSFFVSWAQRKEGLDLFDGLHPGFKRLLEGRRVKNGLGGDTLREDLSVPVVDCSSRGNNIDPGAILIGDLSPEPGMLDDLELKQAEQDSKNPYADKKHEVSRASLYFFPVEVVGDVHVLPGGQ
jgi:hypothetical protein